MKTDPVFLKAHEYREGSDKIGIMAINASHITRCWTLVFFFNNDTTHVDYFVRIVGSEHAYRLENPEDMPGFDQIKEILSHDERRT